MRVGTYTAAVALSVLIASATCIGDMIVVSDDFDNGVLSQNWAIGLPRNCHGWEYTESGTVLSVSDIWPDRVTTPELDAAWSIVSLSRSFEPIVDFEIDWDFAWDSEGDNRAMQKVRLRLYSGNDLVANCSYNDPWIAHSGQKDVRIGPLEDVFYKSGPGSMPHFGIASLDIVRLDDVMTISWDGEEILTGASTAPVDRVELSFWYWSETTAKGISSFFGTEYVDLIVIDAQPPELPEPGTLVMLMLGGLAWLGRARRK